MHIDTVDPPEPFVTYHTPATGRYHSEYIGEVDLIIHSNPDFVLCKLKVYINTPLPPPAGCATCAKVTSLIPELSTETGRVN